MEINRELPEVFDMYEDGQYAFLGFWAKGHWPPDKFGEGFRQCFGANDQRWQRCKNYRHLLARIIPDKEIGSRLHFCHKPGRGAFPVTVFEP
jgi:hypothetical protein